MNTGNLPINNEHHLYGQIKDILTSARAKAYSAVNFAMVEAYWLILEKASRIQIYGLYG